MGVALLDPGNFYHNRSGNATIPAKKTQKKAVRRRPRGLKPPEF
jgi:hypothetical protein